MDLNNLGKNHPEKIIARQSPELKKVLLDCSAETKGTIKDLIDVEQPGGRARKLDVKSKDYIFKIPKTLDLSQYNLDINSFPQKLHIQGNLHISSAQLEIIRQLSGRCDLDIRVFGELYVDGKCDRERNRKINAEIEGFAFKIMV